MSPYLFVVGMEYLSRYFSSLKGNKGFSYHPKCSRNNIIQLLFADDLLIFCRADQSSVELVKAQLQKFSKAFGLQPNQDKSEVYLSGVSEEVKERSLDVLGMSEGSLPFRYLGVPLSSKKLSYSQCRSLIDKITQSTGLQSIYLMLLESS